MSILDFFTGSLTDILIEISLHLRLKDLQKWVKSCKKIRCLISYEKFKKRLEFLRDNTPVNFSKIRLTKDKDYVTFISKRLCGPNSIMQTHNNGKTSWESKRLLLALRDVFNCIVPTGEYEKVKVIISKDYRHYMYDITVIVIDKGYRYYVRVHTNKYMLDTMQNKLNVKWGLQNLNNYLFRGFLVNELGKPKEIIEKTIVNSLIFFPILEENYSNFYRVIMYDSETDINVTLYLTRKEKVVFHIINHVTGVRWWSEVNLNVKSDFYLEKFR